MADTTLPKDELKTRAVEGAPLSQGEVSAIESEETNRTGFGPVKGGPAATAQSIHDKQQAFFRKAGDLARKPVGEITREDAAEVQKAEARALGEPPGAGTTSSVVQSIADQNARAKDL
ncbi:hypothetical protein Daus18300_003996 [Diaporthe australafricana]|uniref:SMP domain-containing protein n=1 Tax=Diaporthe australafricana TaxID=127596 RepID=A0ABR3XBW1_9PEZI